jgi:hypothetical protein
MALWPLRSKASSSSWRWAGVKRSRPSLPARMMEESEGAGWDGVDCIRDYVCSRCPRLASGRPLSAYETQAGSAGTQPAQGSRDSQKQRRPQESDNKSGGMARAHARPCPLQLFHQSHRRSAGVLCHASKILGSGATPRPAPTPHPGPLWNIPKAYDPSDRKTRPQLGQSTKITRSQRGKSVRHQIGSQHLADIEKQGLVPFH